MCGTMVQMKVILSFSLLMFLVTLAQDAPPPKPPGAALTAIAVIDGKTNAIIFNDAVTSAWWEIWDTNTMTWKREGQPLTNSAIAHPERKRKVIAYRKECPECGVSLTSTNITTWLVTEETNAYRMVSVAFTCLGCDEIYVETFKKPIRKTKVEEITVEVVK